MTIKIRREISITDPMTLGELRWLIEQCKGMSDSASVTVQGRKEYNPIDYDPAKIAVISNEGEQ